MNRFQTLLFVLVLIAAAVAGLAYYQGWFDVTVDKEKFQEDKKNAMKRMQDAGGGLKGKSAAPTEKSKDQDASRGDAQREMDKLEGTWRVVSLERDGETASDDAIREQGAWVFQGDKIASQHSVGCTAAAGRG